MYPHIKFPELEVWSQQLASILPLAALLEFVDVAKKLHVFQLSGFNPAWNWPMTPEGARLLLSDEDTSDACCLDLPSRAAELHCMDCKFGNFYPCSAPTTTRFYMKASKPDVRLDNHWPNTWSSRARKNRLDFFLVRRCDAQQTGRHVLQILRGSKSTLLFTVTALGWLFLLALVLTSLLGSLFIAASYLILMPFTGLAVIIRFGGQPRDLLGMDEPGNIDRMVVVTNSLNSSDWSAFYGPKDPVNGLLNRPLLEPERPRRERLSGWMIRFCTAGQWCLALASCVLQNWDAFVITLWIVFCSLVTTYIYPPELAAQDWLASACGLELIRIKVPFTSRRAMLAALVYLNPDQENTGWLDPILSKTHKERYDWESSVLAYSKRQPISPQFEKEYWFKYVEEGVEMGMRIRLEMEKQQRTGKRGNG